MIWSVATVLFFAASSLGDKFISAKLRCTAAEFSFLVALSTAFFLALLLPFIGWEFSFSGGTALAVGGLTVLKLAEFYIGAVLLKQVSAYELKAWLSLNVVFSFLVDLMLGEASYFAAFALCSVVLAVGIVLIAFRRLPRRGALCHPLCGGGKSARRLQGREPHGAGVSRRRPHRAPLQCLYFAEEKWRAHVRVCVENLCEEAPMSVQVCLAGERLVFAERTMSAGETVLEGEVTAENASPWSPASPVLYAAEARLMKNGVPFDDLIERFGFREVRSLDGSRPCSFASCKFKSDLCFGLPDVVSYNIYPLWYHDTPPAEYLADLYGWVQTTEGRGKPFLVTEIGAGGIYGFRAPYMPKWSVEYQAKALREQLGAVLSFPQCSGVYIRQFCDIRVSDEWWGGRPRTMNNKGVFDEYRRPKLCRSAVEEIFSRK